MLSMGTAAMLVAGIIALTLAVFAKRRAQATDLGSVSQQWIAENRADSRWK